MSDQDRRIVAVAGGTGFVGRAIVKEAIERGYLVRVLARDESKAAEVLPPAGSDQLRIIVGDAFDDDALQRLAAPAADGTPILGLINAIGIRREAGPGVTYQRMHVRVTERLIAAAMAHRAERFVQVSALGTRPDAPTAYHRTKYESELALRESTLNWTILRPSIIHGPDGEFMRMVKDWTLGRAQPFFFLPFFSRVETNPDSRFAPPRLVAPKVQPVSVDDVAFAAVESLTNDQASGEVYELVGPVAYDWPTLLTTIRDALPMTDSTKKPIGIPAPLAVIAAVKAKIFGLAGLLPFGPSEPVMGSEDSLASPIKARQQLGLDPRAFEPALHEYADRI
ncbi:MAG: NAD(P)H-binding protein [Phycisphaerales bacterium]